MLTFREFAVAEPVPLATVHGAVLAFLRARDDAVLFGAVAVLPPARRLHGILVVEPADLIAQEVTAYHRRRGQPKAGTDWRDVAVLLLAFPHLKVACGEVLLRLQEAAADEGILATWTEFVTRDLRAAPEDEEY